MTSSIVVPGGQQYYGRWRYRPDGVTLYAHGRPDQGGTPPPPTGAARAQVSRVTTRATFTGTIVTRDDLVAGVDMPTRSTAGCVDRGILTEQASTITYVGSNDPAAPLVISNKWFTGKVSVTAGYVDFLNCQGVGDPVTVGALFQCTNAAVKRVRLYDCDLWSQNPQWDTPAVKGHHVELYRCYIRGCTDGVAHIGVGADGTATGDYTGLDQGIVVQQCLIEQMCYLSPDPGAAGGLTDNSSHLDCIVQFRGGNNLLVKGNRVLAYYDPTIGQGGKLPINLPSGTHLTGDKYATTAPTLCSTSAFMFSPILGTMDGIKIQQNWIQGGVVIANFAGHTTAGTALGGIQITGNRVGNDQRPGTGLGPGSYWLANSALPMSVTGNVQWTVTVWDKADPLNPIYLPDAYGTVTTTAANGRTNG